MAAHWMQKAAAHMKHGVFRNAAKRAGMSTDAYAEKEKNSKNPTMRHRADLALAFMHARHRKG